MASYFAFLAQSWHFCALRTDFSAAVSPLRGAIAGENDERRN
jgi:hypothetical protein